MQHIIVLYEFLEKYAQSVAADETEGDERRETGVRRRGTLYAARCTLNALNANRYTLYAKRYTLHAIRCPLYALRCSSLGEKPVRRNTECILCVLGRNAFLITNLNDRHIP